MREISSSYQLYFPRRILCLTFLVSTELKTLELIWISIVDSFDFRLIRPFPLFMDIPTRLRPKFQISWVHNAPLWLVEFIHFYRYKLKMKLILRLIKGEDQALNLISTILKFSAQVYLKLEQNLTMILFIFPFTFICALYSNPLNWKRTFCWIAFELSSIFCYSVWQLVIFN